MSTTTKEIILLPSESNLIDNPLNYLSEIPAGNHIVMFYENPKRALIMKLWYILHGLIQGQDAVFVSNAGAAKVRGDLRAIGFDVLHYESRNKPGRLHIKTITDDPSKHPLGFSEGMRGMYRKIFEGV